MKLSEKEYRSADGLNKSTLWHLMKSPLHYKYALENPTEETAALLFGRMVHKLLLESDTFDEEYAILPNVDRRTKEGKEAYAQFIAGLNGQSAISADDFEKASVMVQAVKDNPTASKILQGLTETEDSLFWSDDVEGVACKCRLDGVGKIGKRGFILDYKTTQDASLDGFMRSAYKYGYDAQAGHYLNGAKANKLDISDYIIIAQEKAEPYAVNVFVADLDFVESGKRRIRDLISKCVECERSGNWYGYGGENNDIYKLGVPMWAESEEE